MTSGNVFLSVAYVVVCICVSYFVDYYTSLVSDGDKYCWCNVIMFLPFLILSSCSIRSHRSFTLTRILLDTKRDVISFVVLDIEGLSLRSSEE